MISCFVLTIYALHPLGGRASPNQRADASDDDLDADRPMDFDEERG